jgi:hypothetical protein
MARFTKSSGSSKLVKAIKDHPVAAAGIAGTAVLGAVLITKAAKTAARVATIKATAKAATDVAHAVRGSKSRSGKSKSTGKRK